MDSDCARTPGTQARSSAAIPIPKLIFLSIAEKSSAFEFLILDSPPSELSRALLLRLL